VSDGGTGALGNYTVTINPGALTVSPYTPTVTASGTVTYNGTAQAATPSATGVGSSDPTPTGMYTLTYSGNGYGPSAAGPTNAGTYSVAVSFVSADANYSNATGTGSLTISPYAFTYQIGNDSQTYGSPANLAHDLGTTINSGVNGENLDIAYTSSGDMTTANVGSYGISGALSNGTGLLSDYNVTLLNGTLTVNQHALTYEVGNDSQTYGTAANLAKDLGTTIATGVSGQNLDIAYNSSGDTTTANAGSYAITGSLSNGTGLLSNYSVTLLSGTLTVNPYAFVYQIGNDSQTYGTPANLAHDLGTTINTGANSQNLDIAYNSPGDTASGSVGTYPITGTLSSGTGLLANYDVTLLNGTLTVLPATTTVGAGVSGPPDGVLYQPRTFAFTASGGPTDAAAGFTYVINWGDGSVAQTLGPTPNNSTITESHAYTSTGSFTVSVTATDQFDIASAPATQTIKIGLAVVEADGAGEGGTTGLAVSGIGGSLGVVLVGSAGNSMKVTRGGTVLGTYVATNGNIAIFGNGASDLVTVAGAANAANTFTLTGNTATFTSAPFSPSVFTVALNSIGHVVLLGGNQGDSFTNTATTVPSALVGGTGTDTYRFAGTSMGAATAIVDAGGNNTLYGPTLASGQPNTWTINCTNSGYLNGPSWSFAGIQNLVGGASDDTFRFVGSGNLTGNLSGGSGGATLNYQGYTAAVTVNLQTNKASGVGGQATNLVAAIGNGCDTDTLTGANTTNTWYITGNNAGNINGKFTFTAFANLTGGSATDDFVLSNQQSVTGTINGGGGTNRLDYSAYSTGVYVNLRTGAATGACGITAIEQVFGGKGNDILVGTGSGILLQAGSGNDLIIGGSGQATINSGSGQDIIIAASTSYDTNKAALQAIDNYWANTSVSLANRVTQLSGPGISGYKLNASTVTHANASDTLDLGSALDWVFWRKYGTDADNLTGTPGASTLI
jgi:PKD domain